MDNTVKEKLDALLQSEIDQNNAVGTELFIYKDNKKIYEGSFGADTPGGSKKLKEDTIFRMFSMTKPITSLACHIAMEQGLFKRTDPVSAFLPGFKDMKVLKRDAADNSANDLASLEGKHADEKKGTKAYDVVPADREITIADCLSMTAGLEYPNDQTGAGMLLGKELYWPLEEGYPDKKIGTVELLNKTGEIPLLYQPGQYWNYSLCADVIGAVIEVASGMRYGDFLSKYIFEPLGMDDTGFYVPAQKLDRLVTMHDRQGEEWVKWEGTFLGMEKKRYDDPALQVRPEFESGGAGLVSTPHDYTRIAMVFANRGVLPEEYSKDGREVRLISEKSFMEMTAPALSDNQKKTANWYSLEGYNYGSLMRILEDPVKAGIPKVPAGEFGWDGWAGTYISVDPVNNIVLLYFVNQTNGNREWQMKALKNVLYS